MLRLLFAAFVAVPCSAALSQDTARLVGEWNLVSFTSPDSAGRQAPVWGPNPIGLIIYTANGTMAAQLYDPRRGKLGVLPQGANPELVKATFIGGYSYYGTFTVDTALHSVTHHIEGANNPDWIGGNLARAYRFNGKDRLSLTVLTNFDGAKVVNGSVLVWERVRKQ